MINKKLFTLDQLAILEPLLYFQSDVCTVEVKGHDLIIYRDKDKSSAFNFQIKLSDFVTQKNKL